MTVGRFLGKTRRIHFIGVGGIGMSGIAELLANLGYQVSGSDVKRSSVTDRLAASGVTIAEGHRASNVGDADVVVVSSAVRSGNPEVAEAARRGVPVIPRAEMLAELMRMRTAIAVAGAHGKTTTTSMIALALERAGLDPTAVIGGRVSAFGSNARLGSGELMVAEADESDGSFLKLLPTIAVLTNIDQEHLEAYGSFERLQQAFVDFANRVPFHGLVVACLDDGPLAAVLPRITRRVVTYGLSDRAAFTALDVTLEPFGVRATIAKRATDAAGTSHIVESSPLELRVPGRHNLVNALAVVAVCDEIGLTLAQIAAGLGAFKGVERRFDVRGEPNGVLVVDDYGHHPTEIAAVLAAARGLNRRLIVAFQPHRFSRTEALLEAFGPALAAADRLVLTDIYPAGEDPIPGCTLERLVESVRRHVTAPIDVVHRIEDVPAALAAMARPGDVVVTLGAGSIGTVPDRLLHLLAQGTGRVTPGVLA
jgi:UDP-N-acetylmuramate--alanine ligase